MVEVSQEAQRALEALQAKKSGAVIRLHASQVCDCGKIGFDMQWDRERRADDIAEQSGPLTLVYDAESRPYLDGVQVSYTDQLMGKSFGFTNPNLKNGGGCGREFK